MFQAQRQYDLAYKQIRLDLLRGRITAEQAKTWIRSRAVTTRIMIDKELETDWWKMKMGARAWRDIPVMEEDE